MTSWKPPDLEQQVWGVPTHRSVVASPHEAVAIPHAVLFAPSLRQALGSPVEHIFLGGGWAVIPSWEGKGWALQGH